MRVHDDTGVETVTALTLVRQMPELQFASLCERLLSGEVNTSDLTQISPALLARQPAERGRTRQNAAGKCYTCGGPIEAEPLNRACELGTGVPACKACIDEALAAIFGPDPSVNFIVRHVLDRMAADA